MTNPFKVRKPWAVFLVTLLLGPFLGMLYIGRARLAGVYFLLELGVVAAFLTIYSPVFGDPHYTDALTFFGLPLEFIGAGHAAYLAWKYGTAIPVAWYGRWYMVVGYPVVWIALLFANQHLLFPLYYVPSHSMEPGITKNSAVIGFRLAYRFREPARGDVITFNVPSLHVVYVKRIAGLPGERVALRDGVVFINGKPLKLTRVDSHTLLEHLADGRRYPVLDYTPETTFRRDADEVTVPAGQYYVLGDNRGNSLDSRFSEFGFVARTDVIGPVVVKIFDGEERHFMFQRVR